MSRKNQICSIFAIAILLFWAIQSLAQEQRSAAEDKTEAAISISDDMGDTMAREVSRVKEEFQKQARSLFERTPLGWSWKTIDYLYQQALRLPLKIPQFVNNVMEQSRVLGAAGSLIMLTFIVAVLYSLIGQNRVLARIEIKVQPLMIKIPETLYPFILSALKVAVAALIPLLLLGTFVLINAMIDYEQAWFQLSGRLLGLWALGALVVGLMRESLTRNLFQATALYGKTIFHLARLALLYILVGIAVIWAAQAFQIRGDVLALLKFVISVSVVFILFLLHLNKKALLSLLPDLPFGSYRSFLRLLNKYYYPLIFFAFLTALFWCIGYKQFGRAFLIKTWFSGVAYILIMLFYHMIQGTLQKWSVKIDESDETALFLFRSIKALLLYVTVLVTVAIILNLFGLLYPLQRLMSFPVLNLGANQVTFWIIIKAVLILLAFVYASGLLQAYLDYKVYPSIGIDPGLGYALNTFFKYLSFAIGFLISLKIVGIDLRFLLVFAGAIGIGIGLGLQNMAANIISGFTIIFGGKIRKGDWIEVGSTLGVVTDIYLRATKIRTRDHIEYLIPNSDFISKTIVNYSLSSPMIRIELPVGVSYDADPRKVENILLAVAEKDSMVETYRKPAVRFVEYADNSINFELLIWIDVQKTPRRRVRSTLYFAIFEEFKKAGIEIPFPQRDIHIVDQTEQPPIS
ncbi:MAG: mechanosensitive ion channel [Desulfobacterales bacterium]|nr:mechanosensitive ion channel [Desulfobacterales bacterium]